MGPRIRGTTGGGWGYSKAEALQGRNYLGQACDGGVGFVVGGGLVGVGFVVGLRRAGNPDGAEAGLERAAHVGGPVVAHVHRRVGGNAQGVEGKPEDFPRRFGPSNFVREDYGIKVLEQAQPLQVDSKSCSAGHGRVGYEAQGAATAFQRFQHRRGCGVRGQRGLQKGEVVGFPDGLLFVVGKRVRQPWFQLFQENLNLPVEARLPSLRADAAAGGDAILESSPEFFFLEGAGCRLQDGVHTVDAKLRPPPVDFRVLQQKSLP